MLIVQLSSHLDHRPPESSTIEQALRDSVPLRRREYNAWRTSGLERLDRCVEQHSTNTLSAMGGIDNDVVQRTRRSAQRHVVGAFHSRVGIADHLAVPLSDKDDDVRLIDLCPEKRTVGTPG